MYTVSPHSEGRRLAVQETSAATASIAAGASICAGTVAVEALLMSRLQRANTTLSELEILQSPQFLKYCKTFFVHPFTTLEERKNLWEALMGQKIPNVEEARNILKTSSKIRRLTIGTLTAMVMLKAYEAYQDGSRGCREMLAMGIAPFALSPQCVPSRGTLSIRLLKDSSSLPLPECVLPVALNETSFLRQYDRSSIGILPIERRAAPYLISQAIEEHQQSLPSNKRHSGVRKVVVQSLDLSTTTDPVTQQMDLNRNFSIGEEIKLRLNGFKENQQLSKTSSSSISSNTHASQNAQQFHHVHLSMSDALSQAWKRPSLSDDSVSSSSSSSSISTLLRGLPASVKESNTCPVSETSNSDHSDETEDLFLVTMLRNLFPTLPLMKEFSTSEEGHRINQFIRTAYFHQNGGLTHLHLLDLRPLVVTQLLTTLLTTLPVQPLPMESMNHSEADSSSSEEEINQAKSISMAYYFYENYIEPWDFIWDLSVLSVKVASKYFLIATDTIGSIVRSSALDPMLGVDDSNLVVQEKLKDIGLKTGIASNHASTEVDATASASVNKAAKGESQRSSAANTDSKNGSNVSNGSGNQNPSIAGNKVKSNKVLMKQVRVASSGGVEEDELIGLVPRATEVNRLSALFNHECTEIYFDDVSWRASTSMSMKLIQNTIMHSPQGSIIGSVLNEVFTGNNQNATDLENKAPSTVRDQQYLVHGLKQLGLFVSPLSELEDFLERNASMVRPVPSTGSLPSQRSWLQFFGAASWQCLHFTFQQFRTSCLFIHDLLADISGVDHPSRRRLQLIQEQQQPHSVQEQGGLEDDKVENALEPATTKNSTSVVNKNRVIVTVVSNAEEIPYRLYTLTQRFADCHIALVLSANFPKPIDPYTQSLIKTTMVQYSANVVNADSKKIILINPQEVVDKLWNVLPL